MKNPMQPIHQVAGVTRFKSNKLVEALLEHAGQHGLDLNRLRVLYYSPGYDEDWMQLAQLLGYSVDGFCGLPYVSDQDANVARTLETMHVKTEWARKVAP